MQRITIPACAECNQGLSDDEAHFRQILAIAGEPNLARHEIWKVVLDSLDKEDGRRRIADLLASMVPVDTADGQQHMVYPGRDERVLRVVRKIIRGLCHYHGIESGVADARVTADIMKYQVPPEFLEELTYQHCEPDVAEYRYVVWQDGEVEHVQSTWLLTFYEHLTFIGWVQYAT